MFGIPIAVLISLAIKYGPDAVAFIKAADPLVHDLVVAATPLAKKVMADFGSAEADAIEHGVKLLTLGTANWQQDDWQRYWDKAQGIA